LTVEQFRNFINGWGKDKMLQIYLKVGEKKDDSLCWCECWSEVLRPTNKNNWGPLILYGPL
jgi:hypothetical protein